MRESYQTLSFFCVIADIQRETPDVFPKKRSISELFAKKAGLGGGRVMPKKLVCQHKNFAAT
jgi:hypothetical protein